MVQEFLHQQGHKKILIDPRAPSYLNSRLLVYVTIGYTVPRTHDIGSWSPRQTFANLKSGDVHQNFFFSEW